VTLAAAAAAGGRTMNIYNITQSVSEFARLLL
jgi:hypothetical protein